jgi:hypothetical protein
VHPATVIIEVQPPLHERRNKTSARTAPLPILGSPPWSKAFRRSLRQAYGIRLIIAISVLFALSTIATYALLCVYSTAGLQRVRLGAFERFGEVLSGAFIALVGVAFWI